MLLPGESEVGLNVTEVPAGSDPVVERFIVVENPPMMEVPRVKFAEFAVPHVTLAGVVALNEKSAVACVILKFALDISKKIFPIASTFILAVVVTTAGITTDSVPSLSVLSSNTVGKVRPPSVDIDIFTLLVLNGEAFVLATFQVAVAEEPPTKDSPPLG